MRGDRCIILPFLQACLRQWQRGSQNSASERKHASLSRNPSAAKARIYFIDLKDGATIPSKVKIRFGIEKTMHVHDEIAEMGVVDGLLRLRLPVRVGRCVIREDADHVELVQILELHIVERLELAAVEHARLHARIPDLECHELD